MGPYDAQWLWDTLLYLPPLLLSLVVHEYAHAKVALIFGDDTAARLGRVSLNPLVHLDIIGTLMLIFSRMVGWAKPVPVNPYNLRHRPLSDILVSLAGPLSNLAHGLLCGLVALAWVVWYPLDWAAADVVFKLLWRTMVANFGLCFFNLIPLFPLDGHHIARHLLRDERRQAAFMQWQLRFGGLILMVLLLGPRVIETVTGRALPVDPLGLYLHWFIDPIVNALFPFLPPM